jgi:hypothetical protein
MNDPQQFEKVCDALDDLEEQKYYPKEKVPLPPKLDKSEPPIKWRDEYILDDRRIQVEHETNFPKKKLFFRKQDQEPEQFWQTLGGTNIQYQITSEYHHRIREIDKQKQDAKERLKRRKEEYFIQAHKDLEENDMKAASKCWNIEDDLKKWSGKQLILLQPLVISKALVKDLLET